MADDNNAPLSIKEQMAMPWSKLLKSTLKRPVALISKAVSFKGATVALATILVLRDSIESWHWVIMVSAIVLGRDILDKLKK
jgi:hypothetical protein